MKKVVLSGLAALVALYSCNKIDNGQEEEKTDYGRSIVIYFSHPVPESVDATSGASMVYKDNKLYGSVQYMAEVIQKETDSDIHRITVAENHYPGTYQALADAANKEKADGVHPALTSKLTNLDDYDTIFLGSPIWWYTLPMPVFSFLDQYDLSGKKVIPFTAHEGSGLGGAPATIKAEEPGATVETNGFSARGNSVISQDSAIKDWLKKLGF